MYSKSSFKFFFILLSFSFSGALYSKSHKKWQDITKKHMGKSESSLCSKIHYKSSSRVSPLMKNLLNDIAPYLKKGTVDPFRIFSGKNFASTRVYRTGDEIFGLAKNLIENAEHEVLLQTFLYEKNSMGVIKLREGVEALEARLKKEEKKGKKIRPVNVKILVDNQSGLVGYVLEKSGLLWRGLKQGNPDGHDVYGLGFKRPIDKKYVRIEVQLYNHTMNGSNHSKTIVIDRSLGIVTGANLMKYHDKYKKWGDISPETDHAFFVMGSVGKGLAEDFYYAWKKGSKYFTNDPEKMVPRSGYNELDRLKRFKLPKVVEHWVTKRILEKGVPMALITRKAVNMPLSRKSDNPQDQALLSLFKNAKSHINIVSPNLNAPPLMKAMVETLKRGVDINILLSKNYQDFISKMPLAGGTNLKNVKKIIAKRNKFAKKNPKKKVGVFNIRWFVDRKGRISKEVGQDKDKLAKWTSHTKYMSVDNQLTLIGSANMDSQSWYYSRELNIALDHHEITRKWCNLVFRTDFLRALPFDPNEKN